MIDWGARQRKARGFDSFTGATRKYEVTASEEFLDRFDKFMAYVNWCGQVGHSCTVGLEVDGDGADRPKIEVPGIKVKESEVVNKNGPYERLS